MVFTSACPRMSATSARSRAWSRTRRVASVCRSACALSSIPAAASTALTSLEIDLTDSRRPPRDSHNGPLSAAGRDGCLARSVRHSRSAERTERVSGTTLRRSPLPWRTTSSPVRWVSRTSVTSRAATSPIRRPVRNSTCISARSREEPSRSAASSTARSSAALSARVGGGSTSTRASRGGGRPRASSRELLAASARLAVEGASPRSTSRRRQSPSTARRSSSPSTARNASSSPPAARSATSSRTHRR